MLRYNAQVWLLAASSQAEGSILNFDKNLLFGIGVQLFNVTLLTVLLLVLLYKPVRGYMAGRTERVRKEIEAARKEREDAMELKERYEKMLEDIHQEREEVLRQAHKKAVEKSDKMLFDARHEAEAMYSRALAELELERKNVEDEMKRQIIEISTLMAGQFVLVSIDQSTQDKMIEEAFADWEGS